MKYKTDFSGASRRLKDIGAACSSRSFAAVCGLAVLFIATPASAQNLIQRLDTAFAFSGSGTVTVSAVSGDINITTGRADQIRIQASVRHGSIVASLSPSAVSIRARSVSGRLEEIQYNLVVPQGVRVRTSSVSGDMIIRGTKGEVRAQSTSGDIQVTDAARGIQISTVSGSVDIGSASGDIRISTVSGDVEGTRLSGNIAVETVSGDVEVSESEIRDLRFSSTSGDLMFQGGLLSGGVSRLSTHSGDVELRIPAATGATFELQTFSGDIFSAFPVVLQPSEGRRIRNRRMEFTVGDGGGRIAIETFSGDISIGRIGQRNQEN